MCGRNLLIFIMRELGLDMAGSIFFVEESIILELKALAKLEDAHLAQTMNYCNTFKLHY